MDTTEKLIGKRISEARASRGMTQEDLADLCRIAPCTISRIETGHSTAPLKTLITIAEQLNIGLDYLLCDLFPGPNAPTQSLQIREIIAILEQLDGSYPEFIHSIYLTCNAFINK